MPNIKILKEIYEQDHKILIVYCLIDNMICLLIALMSQEIIPNL